MSRDLYPESLSNSATAVMLNQMRLDIAMDPENLRNVATLGVFCIYELGPTAEVIKLAMEQVVPTEREIEQLAIKAKKEINLNVTPYYNEVLASLAVSSGDSDDEICRHQSRRRSLVRRVRDQVPNLAWIEAERIVREEPERVVEYFTSGKKSMERAFLKAVHTMVPKIKSLESFHGQMHRRILTLANRMEGLNKDKFSETEAIALAAEEFGGFPLLAICSLAIQITMEAGRLAHIGIVLNPEDMIEGLDHKSAPGLVVAAAARLPVWEEYARCVQDLSTAPYKQWPEISCAWVVANAMATDGHEIEQQHRTEFQHALREESRENRRLTKRTAELQTALNTMRRTQEEERKRAAQPRQAPNAAPVNEETMELRRTIERMRNELDAQREELLGTRALLDSIISIPPAEPQDNPLPVTESELKGMRGVIIGGHPIFLNKLRKTFPKYTYYSADQKRIDEQSIIGSDFVVFFTGYCNHSLTENALRLCRQYDIPTGYSSRVNLDHFIADVGQVIGRGE